MNGSYPYNPLHANQPMHPTQPIPMPAPGTPFPTAGVPQFPPYPMPQPHIDGHNFNVPPMSQVNMPAEMEHVNNGHHAMSYPPHPIIINPEILIPATGERYYPRYNARLPEEHHASVPYRTFVPTQNNVHMYPGPGQQDAPPPGENYFTPIHPEIHTDYRVNANTYGPRPDAVWAPNPGEMFNFGDMRTSIPQPQPLPAEQVFPPGITGILPIVRSHRSSPVEGVGARTVGGPVAGTGAVPGSNPEPFVAPASVPTVSANGPPPSQTVAASRLAVGADRLARERLSVTERLSAAAHAYQVSGSDDQELEAGLQDLERRIDTLFKIAD